MKVIAGRLDSGFHLYQEEYEKKAIDVLRSGWYVLGNEVSSFEREFAAYTGARYCTGVASGLDALQLAVRALGIGKGDEVIVQGNTYIASVMGITMNGSTPIFVEPNEFHNIDTKRIENLITPKTKAIMVVHLYGQAAKMDDVMDIAERHHLRVIEDCAQSHGATFNGKMTGTFGDIGCFSFYPTKNLGAFGDGGAIVTDNEELDKKVRMLRNYGSDKKYCFKEVGVNSRLDELQAGLLRVRLSHIEETTKSRVSHASYYSTNINNPRVETPALQKGSTSVWHQYVVTCNERDRLKEYLADHDIGTLIHYPIPPHLSEAYSYLGFRRGDYPITERLADTVLSLPMYDGITDEEIAYVVEAINTFR